MAATVPWTEDHVRRLFWRAGFGATPAEARKWSKRGFDQTLNRVLNADGSKLPGATPRINGVPLDPLNEFGHDQLFWIDRMVRSPHFLEEKMTLFWHDHFACKDQTPLMLAQNETLRRLGLGDFRTLLRAITLDPAMQRFLSLAGSNKKQPNENFARELFELFTLGTGYTEDDIREAARALTGFRAPRDSETNLPVVTYTESRHDTGVKTIFGRSGRFTWEDVLELAVTHPDHGPFLVGKLWSFFVTTPIDTSTLNVLTSLYLDSGLRIKPVVSAILQHGALYRALEAPDMVKAPPVYIAGFLRSTGRQVDRDWSILMRDMGMKLFSPPSVAGWDWGPAWLSTKAMQARFQFASEMTKAAPVAVKPGSASTRNDPVAAVAAARKVVGDPFTTRRTDKILRQTAAQWGEPRRPKKPSKQTKRRAPLTRTQAETLQISLRHLLISGPDAQLH
jgi:uncharacterized protein (DUF1800 family)